MRMLILAACAALSACAAAAAAPPPAPPMAIPPAPLDPPVERLPVRDESPVRDAAARSLARELLTGLADRVVEARFNRVAAGPGRSVLADITLFERPRPSHQAPLCQITAHVVRPAGPHAGTVDSQQRYHLGGTTLPGAGSETLASGCGNVPVTDFFTVGPTDDPRVAMETYEWGRRWAAEGSRAVVVECLRYGDPCSDGAAVLARHLRPQLIRAVSRVPCDPAWAAGARDDLCWRYELAEAGPGAPGPWTVIMRGPNRPMRVLVRQDMPPVS